MIVGNGMLANAFSERYKNDPDVLIFASGVSNSQETLASAFQREKDMLSTTINSFKGSHLVYFGSCGVTNKPETLSPYLSHKLQMEKIVRRRPNGFVFRLPQVVGRTPNQNTLTNFIYKKIMSGEHFTVWANAERNLMDIDDIAAITSALLSTPSLTPDSIAIASTRSLPSLEIVRIFEHVLGVRGNYTIVDSGDPLKIEADRANQTAKTLGIDLEKNYVERVIRKYYAPPKN